MDEPNAVAPDTPGEATPSTPKSEAATPAAPIEPSEPLPFSLEEAKAIKNFLDSNGGFDKVKKNLTVRQADMQAQAQTQTPNPLNDPTAQQPLVAAQPQQPATPKFTGGISTEEFMTQQYFETLSKREEYASISDQIQSGEVLKHMAEFNISPMIDGRINTDGVTKFLDLYAKTVPAKAAETPMTTTPTVEYVQVGETITNINDAMRVLAQDKQLRSQGQAGHPMAKQANDYFDSVLNANQNRGRVEHTTLEEAQKQK